MKKVPYAEIIFWRWATRSKKFLVDIEYDGTALGEISFVDDEWLLQVASSQQLDVWYADRKGLGSDESWQKKRHGFASSPPPSSGGLFMVGLLMDLLEELQFGQWMCGSDDTINVNNSSSSIGDRINSMSSSRLLSSGVTSNIIDNDTIAKKNSMGGKNNGNAKFSTAYNVEYGDRDRDGYDDSSSPPLSSTIPQWYNVAIAVLAQIGRTENGMTVLWTRSPDDRESDWMGNALDVSIRQLHTLALHLDDVRTCDGSIVRLGKCTCVVGDGNSNYNRDDNYIEDHPHTARLRRSVEAWVRLWHQVLLFVQSKATISFRSLVLDVRDWYTSSCATLLTSEEIRPEIRSMIRWQLDELLMDEEDYEESKHQSR